MSSSGSCRNRNFLLGLIGIVLMGSSASGDELGVYSREVVFTSSVDEWTCENVELFSSSPALFGVTNMWTQGSKREISEYTTSADDLGLELIGREEIAVHGKEQLEYCIKGEEPGTYEGVLLFRPQEGMFGLGTWLKVEITGEGRTSRETDSLERDGFSYLVYVLGLESIVLASMLSLLVFAFRKRGQSKKEAYSY